MWSICLPWKRYRQIQMVQPVRKSTRMPKSLHETSKIFWKIAKFRPKYGKFLLKKKKKKLQNFFQPSPKAPERWQCTDVAGLESVLKNRSCLAYDNSNGYTFYQGECVPSDYNGCIDTYNKFKDLETCTRGTFLILRHSTVHFFEMHWGV